MGAIIFRRATIADLEDMVALLADDELGKERERPGPPHDPAYDLAFDAIGI